MITWLTGLIASFKTLILAGLVVVVLLAVVGVFHKTKSVVESLVVLLLGAGLVWAANNLSAVQDKIGTTVNNPGALRAPARIDPPGRVALARSNHGTAVLTVYRSSGDR